MTEASSKRIAVLVGSLREGSWTRKVAQAMGKIAKSHGLDFDIVEIGDLPLYNEDLEGKATPQAWTRFREQVKTADGVLFMTPEYNRSVPAALKNALDVGSRPYGSSVWDGKPGGVVSVSPGAMGGFGANHHLRQSLVFLNVPVLQQPEAYLGGAAGYFDEAGNLAKDDTRAFLDKYVVAFADWLSRTEKK